MTGAKPNTAWLKECVPLDEQGFVLTENDLTPSSPFQVTSMILVPGAMSRTVYRCLLNHSFHETLQDIRCNVRYKVTLT